MKKYYALFPLIAVIYPSLFLYANNTNEIAFISILPFIGYSLIATIILQTFFLLLTRNLMKASLLTLPLIIFFFTLGHLDLFLIDLLWEYESVIGELTKMFGSRFAPQMFYAFWLSLFFLFFFIYWTIKATRFKDEKVYKLTQSFFAITVVLNTLCLIQLSSSLLFHKETKTQEKTALTSTQAATDAPDIYYIIPDGYPRADILKKYYKFDNAPFINFLKERGFFIPTNNFSNYSNTFQSLTSSLNMKYINYFVKINGEKSKYKRNVFAELSDNEVLRFLKSKGYTYYHHHNSWQGVSKNDYADIQIPCLSLAEIENPFKNLFWNSTALIMMPLEESAFSRHKCHMNNMKSLNSMPSKPGPKFVFTHFRAPHPPYLFNRKGEWIKNDLYTEAAGPRVKAWFHFDLFTDQIYYMNTQFMELVDNIIKNSKRPPIIVIQSDHGGRINNNQHTFEYRKARHSNFIAIYHPKGTPIFNDNITPVNIFPILFNSYLGSDLPIRQNKFYFSKYGSPYTIHELELQ